MSRLVGHGKRKARKAKSSSGSDEEMEGGAMSMYPPRFGRPVVGRPPVEQPPVYGYEPWNNPYLPHPSNDPYKDLYPEKLLGSGNSHPYQLFSSEHPAYQQGKMMANYINKTHGGEHSQQMLNGMLHGAGFMNYLPSPIFGVSLETFLKQNVPGVAHSIGLGSQHHPAQHQGKMLAEFMRTKYGDEHGRHFLHGALHGGAWWDFLDPNKNGVRKWFSDTASKVKNEFVNPQSVLRAKIVPGFQKVAKFAAPIIDAVVPGQGAVVSGIGDIAQGVNKGAEMLQNAIGAFQGKGLRSQAAASRARANMTNPYVNPTMPGSGRPRKGSGQPNGVSERLGSPSNGGDPTGAVDVGRAANPGLMFARNTVGMGRVHPTAHARHRVRAAPEGVYFEGGYGGINHNNPTGTLNTGAGKKTRAKAGANDARKKRGAEVSRLMREKGMTLGQASKHIKEHGY
jgi:hypothetical protein